MQASLLIQQDERRNGTAERRPIGQASYAVVLQLRHQHARRTKDLLWIADRIKEKGAGLEVLNIDLDTTTPTGKLMLTVLGAIAEFEREIMLERQRDGIAVAKRDGKYRGGKPVAEDTLRRVQELIDGGVSVSQAVKEAGISRRTYYKALKEGRI